MFYSFKFWKNFFLFPSGKEAILRRMKGRMNAQSLVYVLAGLLQGILFFFSGVLLLVEAWGNCDNYTSNHTCEVDHKKYQADAPIAFAFAVFYLVLPIHSVYVGLSNNCS